MNAVHRFVHMPDPYARFSGDTEARKATYAVYQSKRKPTTPHVYPPPVQKQPAPDSPFKEFVDDVKDLFKGLKSEFTTEKLKEAIASGAPENRTQTRGHKTAMIANALPDSAVFQHALNPASSSEPFRHKSVEMKRMNKGKARASQTAEEAAASSDASTHGLYSASPASSVYESTSAGPSSPFKGKSREQ